MTELKPGEQRLFAYPTAFTTLPEYSAHRGQLVTVVRPLQEGKEYDLDPDGPDPMYRVKASDGWEGDAWESELLQPSEGVDLCVCADAADSLKGRYEQTT